MIKEIEEKIKSMSLEQCEDYKFTVSLSTAKKEDKNILYSAIYSRIDTIQQIRDIVNLSTVHDIGDIDDGL